MSENKPIDHFDMAPTPWMLTKAQNWIYTTAYVPNGGDIICLKPDMPSSADRFPNNAAAIVSAVNGTYGKGIHPDAVEDLLEALKEMTLFYYMDHSGVLPTEKKILSAAKAAIEKAAIK